MIEYELLRQKRKSISIQITKEGTVLVKAPEKVEKKVINDFINQKSSWIDKHLSKRQAILNKEPEYKAYYGGKVLFFGKEIPVKEMDVSGMELTQEALYIQVNADPYKAAKVFKALAKEVAFDYYSKRLEYYCKKMGLKDYKLRVNNAKGQWGSCSSKRTISLSLRLIGAEPDLIDYVIVHELAHLVYMDHQEKFWNLVSSVIPNYEEKRKAIRFYGQKIAPEKWL